MPPRFVSPEKGRGAWKMKKEREGEREGGEKMEREGDGQEEKRRGERQIGRGRGVGG